MGLLFFMFKIGWLRPSVFPGDHRSSSIAGDCLRIFHGCSFYIYQPVLGT